MTAIQVTENITDVMKLPCVESCRKSDVKGREGVVFYLWNGDTAEISDWILNERSVFGARVVSNLAFQILKKELKNGEL